MAYTNEQHSALTAAIAQGALRVKYADKEIEYRSLDEMQRIKREMEAQLFPTRVNSGRAFASFSKGIR